MVKKVIISGLSGGLVLIIWTFAINVVFGFRSSLDMNQIRNERQVYEILKENIVEPGRYICNPELTPEQRSAGGEPVFSVLYSGIGHESAGGLLFVELVIFLLAPLIGAWMLSQASERILTSYSRKVLFFVAIGLIVALFADMMNYGIGGYPLNDALIQGAQNVIAWTLVGLVVAWRMKPEEGSSMNV